MITLIWNEIDNTKKNDNGFPEPVRHTVDVYADEKSVGRTEKYEAMRSGIDVSLVLSVRTEDWELTRHTESGRPSYARKVLKDGCEYNIIRAYKTGKARIELTCG